MLVAASAGRTAIRSQLGGQSPDQTRTNLENFLANGEALPHAHVKQLRRRLENLDALDAMDWSHEGAVDQEPVISLTLDRGVKVNDVRRMTEADRESAARECGNPGMGNAYTHEHAYLAAIATHLMLQRVDGSRNNPRLAMQLDDAIAFQKIAEALLGTKVEWTMTEAGIAVPLLFGREFSQSELSEGQKILLAWTIVLHKQRESLRNAVVLIDEPENHLHPDVCSRALTQLQREVLGDHGQIWLATHSIPLIAWAGIEALYAVKDGTVEYAGNRVSEVVDTLAGGADGRERLRTFLADAERVGFMHFIAQSLADPGVARGQDGDPQEQSFAELVARLSTGRERLRILDFGAGRGRLAQALTTSFAGRPGLLDRLSYVAFDPSPDHADERTSNVAKLRSAGADAESVEDIRKLALDGAGVDLVVMCNVLHEIEPQRWQRVFQDCRNSLRPEGSLVVIEDQRPAVGELPHEKGFIVLDHVEMQAMFGGSDTVRSLPDAIPEPYRTRVTVLELPAKILGNWTSENQTRALEMVRSRARDAVERLRDRNAPVTQQSGRLHALYAMLWMNADMALNPGGARQTS